MTGNNLKMPGKVDGLGPLHIGTLFMIVLISADWKIKSVLNYKIIEIRYSSAQL